jgi:hypothetical protein
MSTVENFMNQYSLPRRSYMACALKTKNKKNIAEELLVSQRSSFHTDDHPSVSYKDCLLTSSLMNNTCNTNE